MAGLLVLLGCAQQPATTPATATAGQASATSARSSETAPTAPADDTVTLAFAGDIHFSGRLEPVLSRPDPLVAALRPVPNLTLGLLSGNFEESGLAKIRACGIKAEQFKVAAWGDDSPHDPPDREHLPPVAMSRYRARFDREIHPGRVTIVGDTRHDIRCAKASGCRVLAVATGRSTVMELEAHGPDLAVEDLSDTARLHGWLTGV